MKTLRDLPSKVLLQRVRSLAQEERRATLEVLHHLREVDRRRLWAGLGYSSLYGFAMKELKYSGGAAHRRIEAMRLLSDLPEVEDEIAKGEFDLSVVSQVQGFFKAERSSSLEEKRQLLDQVKGMSTREVEQVLVSLAPAREIPKDQVRPLTGDLAEVRFVADAELQAMLEKLGEAHSGSLNEALKKALGTYLAGREEKTSRRRIAAPAPGRYVRSADRRALESRSGGRCEFTATNGRRCEERRRLQVEHVVPHAMGGSNDFANLKHLCPAHNQWRAIRAYGAEKMAAHIPELD